MPIKGATISQLDPVFTWSFNGQQGTVYEIMIAEDANFTQNTITLRTIYPNLHLSLPYLKKNKAYYWTVRAVYSQNQQAIQTEWSHLTKKDKEYSKFFVTADALGDAGYQPNTVLPEEGSEVRTLQPEFRWSYPDNSKATFELKNNHNEWVKPYLSDIKYMLQLSTSMNFLNDIKTFEVDGDSMSFSLKIPFLKKGQTYFWHVKAVYTDPVKGSLTESDWSGAAQGKSSPATFKVSSTASGIFGFEEGQKEEMVDQYKLESVIRLTSGSDNYYSPAVSADGKKLAFCSDREGQSEIFVKNLDEHLGGGETRKTITQEGMSNFSPFWLFNNSEVCFYSNRYNVETVWELYSSTRGSGTGVTLQTVKMEISENPREFNLFGSCSGSGLLVFTGKFKNSSLCRLFLKDMKDNSITELQPGMFPCISNDDRIVFATDGKGDRNFEIMVVELDGHSINNPTILASHPSADFDPAFSPDGSRIAFCSLRSGNSDIWVMNSDGTDLKQVTFHPMADRRPQWIDSETIVFQSNRITNNADEPKWNIYKVNVPKEL